MLVLSVLASACADPIPTGDGGGGGGGYEHPIAPDQVILRIEMGGGFVPIEYSLRAVPQFSLMGDGRAIVEGPQIEIYPPPALPALLESRLSEQAIQEVLVAADEAGLLGPDRSYDLSTVVDATTTTFTVVVDGKEHRVSANALGYGEDDPSIAAEDREARAALVRFQQRLFDLRSWLPKGSVGEETTYRFDALRLFVAPYRRSPDPELKQPEQGWPLPGSLASFGEPTATPDLRCGVVEPEEAQVLVPLLQGSNQLTPWESGGERFLLTPRPLLPDEGDCPASGTGA